jgi:UDP-N-acetylglucosamine 2-epimerase (non-hydrolysing)
MNRRLISRLCTVHLAPTEIARRNLLAEGYPEEAIRVTGNTIVDTLHAFGDEAARRARAEKTQRVVVTLHRRENAEAVDEVVEAVRVLAKRDDIEILWVAHPNATGKAAAAALTALPHVRLVPPYGYRDFIALIASARAVLTDSGGVQEEAPVLGVPVVVLRRETDRPEAISAGHAELAGTDRDGIVNACLRLLDDPEEHERRSRASSPFGDGHAGARICKVIEDTLGA